MDSQPEGDKMHLQAFSPSPFICPLKAGKIVCMGVISLIKETSVKLIHHISSAFHSLTMIEIFLYCTMGAMKYSLNRQTSYYSELQ